MTDEVNQAQPDGQATELPAQLVGNVRMGQYLTAKRGSAREKLVTDNIIFCLGFAGVQEESGVVFLAHLNLPACPLGMGELIADLKEKGGDLSRMKLYTISGLHPMVGWVLLLLGAAGLLIGAAVEVVWVIAAVFGAALLGTRISLWWQLNRLRRAGFGDLQIQPLNGRAIWWSNFRRWYARVEIDAGTCGDPTVQRHREPFEHHLYERVPWREQFTLSKMRNGDRKA